MKTTVRTVAEAQAIINQIAPASYKNYSLFSTGDKNIDAYIKNALKKNDEVSLWHKDKENDADNEYCIYTNREGKAGVRLFTWNTTENDYVVVAEFELDYSEEITEEKAEVEVEEYAVSVEAQEIATQAEFDAAKENAEKLNPFSKFGSWYSNWKSQANTASGENIFSGDRENLVAEKVEVARYGSNVRAEAVREENALVISNPNVENKDEKALVVFYFNPQGKPAAYVKTRKTDTYRQYGRRGRVRTYEINERLVFNKYVKEDRLEYALAIFNLTVNQLVELHNKLAVGEQATLTYNKTSKSYKEVENDNAEEKTSAEMTVSVPKNTAKALAQKLIENIKTLSSIHTVPEDTYEVFDVNTKATVRFDNTAEAVTTFDEAYKKATAFFLTEDDGSNDDAEEDFLSTLDTSIDADGEDDDELVDEAVEVAVQAEPVKEKIYFANWFVGYDSPKSDFREFKSAVEAYKFLKKKTRRYKNTTYWTHQIEVWDGTKSEYIYESINGDEKTTDTEIQALIDDENWQTEISLNAHEAKNFLNFILANYDITTAELFDFLVYYYEKTGNCYENAGGISARNVLTDWINAKKAFVDAEEYAVTPEAFEVAVQAEIDKANSIQFDLQAANNETVPEIDNATEFDGTDEDDDLISWLEKNLEENAGTAVEETTEEVIEYKPKLADKPYTCVTVRFDHAQFNPEKFFYTLNDAVKYALTDKHKRMDWDEHYGGAVVYIDYENGKHRPIWQITNEGNFETVDASEDYGELDNESVKAELAELDEGTLAELAAEVEIKATLDKLAELKAAHPKIYSKATTASKLTAIAS